MVKILYAEISKELAKSIRQHMLDHDIKTVKEFVIQASKEKIERI